MNQITLMSVLFYCISNFGGCLHNKQDIYYRLTKCAFTLQAGYSWALTVFQRCLAMESNKAFMETNVHCSVLNDKSPQDTNCVLAMLMASLELYKKSFPEVTEVYLRSDNAGII